MSTIHLFGNPGLPEDALAPRLLPRLKQALPGPSFRLTDPNELDLPTIGEEFIAIDIVAGLKSVREISLEEIAATEARATTHDFDLASHLLLAQKIRPGLSVRIFGIPMGMDEETAFRALLPLLKSL